MFDRDFETFLLEHVRRERATFYGIMIAIGGCSIACIVMAVAALIIFGLEAIGPVIELLILCVAFGAGCLGVRSEVRSSKEAVEEMAYGLDHPECNIPDDYLDETKGARREACRKIHHIRGLIVSYGVLSITLWGATVLLAALAGIGTQDFSMMMFLVAFIMFGMALPLTLLTIAYIKDYPESRKYREMADQILNEGQSEEQEKK